MYGLFLDNLSQFWQIFVACIVWLSDWVGLGWLSSIFCRMIRISFFRLAKLRCCHKTSLRIYSRSSPTWESPAAKSVRVSTWCFHAQACCLWYSL